MMVLATNVVIFTVLCISKKETVVGIRTLGKGAPKTCASVRSNEPRKTVFLSSGIRVTCDTQTGGGGWTVIQRRTNGRTSFSKSWFKYKIGFGTLDGDFWIGNDEIFRMTNTTYYELRVDIGYKNKTYYARYRWFSISGEDDLYRLHIGTYMGNAGDSLSSGHYQQFSTYDTNNDAQHSRNNCARSLHGAWWYRACSDSNLNGDWDSKTPNQGINWRTLTGMKDSAQWTEMKIRHRFWRFPSLIPES